MANPSMVILYTDPINKAECRILYREPGKNQGHNIQVESRGQAGLGEPQWGSGHVMTHDHVLAFLFSRLALHDERITSTMDGPLLLVDARGIEIPAQPY
jgi:hypothetical protein